MRAELGRRLVKPARDKSHVAFRDVDRDAEAAIDILNALHVCLDRAVPHPTNGEVLVALVCLEGSARWRQPRERVKIPHAARSIVGCVQQSADEDAGGTAPHTSLDNVARHTLTANPLQQLNDVPHAARKIHRDSVHRKLDHGRSNVLRWAVDVQCVAERADEYIRQNVKWIAGCQSMHP